MSSASLGYCQTYYVYLLYTSNDRSIMVLAKLSTCTHLIFSELIIFWHIGGKTLVKKNSSTPLPLRVDSIGY
jgi:hypothetical protein